MSSIARSPEDTLAYYRNNRWAFLCDLVFTKDQVDRDCPIKAFPSDWDYLRWYVAVWERQKLLAVPKSRRMFMSWCNLGLFLHGALFFPGQDFALVSKKEDDAGELIRKLEFVYDHIPPERFPRELLPKKETRAKPAALIFPDIDSKLQGFPMGADQLRQFTFSGILGDESAFWEDAQKFYSAAFPTIEGGGRMTLISSRAPGFFQRIVYDQLDNTDPVDEYKFPAPRRRPFGDDSVITWKNPKNRFFIFDVHYTANPNKRAPGFKEAVRSSMPIKDFLVEYERSWEAYDGTPVFGDYSRFRHESPVPKRPYLGLPLLVGWDFGLTPAAVVAQLQGPHLIILKEFVSAHSGIAQFAPLVMNSLRQLYPDWSDTRKDFLHFVDPAGFAQSQTDQRTCVTVMAEAGLRNISPGPVDWESRKKAVEHFLLFADRDGQGFVLCPQDSPKLAKGLGGAYRYPDKYQQAEPSKPKPIKDEYSHVADALQYLCGGALSLLRRTGSVTGSIPTPRYSINEDYRPLRGPLGEEYGHKESDSKEGGKGFEKAEAYFARRARGG